MKIILTAVEQELTEAWKRFCGDLEGVSVHHGSILDVRCDAVVSPANSFGFMDGGIDLIFYTESEFRIYNMSRSLIIDAPIIHNYRKQLRVAVSK